MIATETLENAPTLGSVVGRIAAFLEHGGAVLTSGDTAALRRMDPRKPVAPFFKIIGVALEEQLPAEPFAREDYETRWSAIVIGLSHLGDLYRPGMRLGRTLAEAGFSDLRFSRLLRADTERLLDDLPMVARFLAAKSVPVDWTDAARLILSSDRSDEEKVRRNLARDYYSALARKRET